MKKIISSIILSSIIFTGSTFAYTDLDIQSANFIAQKNIINNNSLNILWYNLDGKISRREMLKVMMNVSGKTINESCEWKYADMWSSDWGCKYAESALLNWYIAANTNYRPDDQVTQIEALKMIMQATGLEKDSNDDWRAGYLSKAQKVEIVDSGYFNYDDVGIRWWIFSLTAKTYSDFTYSTPDIELTDEEEEIFKYLLEL